MISFNLDYLTKNMKKGEKVQKEKGFVEPNIRGFISTLDPIYKHNSQTQLRRAFTRILISRRARVEKLIFIQNYFKRSVQASFLRIKRYAFLNDKTGQISKEGVLNFPVAIIKNVYQNLRKRREEQGFDRIRKMKRYQDNLLVRLQKFSQIFECFQKRNCLTDIYSVFRNKIRQIESFTKYADPFEKIFENIRKRLLFSCFSQLVIKCSAKHLTELQKQKIGKRDQNVSESKKRSQIINDLKRKNNTMKGQVNEGKIQNNKKKVDGSRDNGLKMMKKTEQFRNCEMTIAQLTIQNDKMQQDIARKQNFSKNRPKGSVSFGKLQQTYNWINQIQQDTVNDKILLDKIPKSHQQDFRKGSNYQIQDSVRLKQLINLHEKLQVTKKSQIYLNAENENLNLKILAGSLIRMQYFETKREQLNICVGEVQQTLVEFKQEAAKSRVQRLNR